MSEDEPVTRREFDQLARRVESIDSGGTRGVLVVQERIADLQKDVTKLEVQFEQHETRHENERREARAGRRWVMTTAVATVTTLATLVGALVALVGSGALHH